MVVANLQNYTLMGILRSSPFYENIITARDITRGSSCESSFCVYGDEHSFTLTVPFKEQVDSCDFQEEKDDFHPRHNQGLYTPRRKSRLIDLHFHSDNLLLDYIGIPSRDDLKDQQKVSFKNFELGLSANDGRWFNLVSIIGYYSAPNNITKLFFGQYVNPDFPPRKSLPARLSRLMGQELGNDGWGFDILDQQLPRKAAQVLSASGKYRAEVISFRNRLGYLNGLSKLESWVL